MFEIGQTVHYKTNEYEIPREARIESPNFNEHGDITSYKIRILSWYRGAGQCPTAFAHELSKTNDSDPVNEEIEEHHEPRWSIWEKLSENFRKYLVIAFIAITAIGIGYAVISAPKSEQPQIILDTIELNGINLSDAKDLHLKGQAEERIKAREPRKNELLKNIGFGK